jgi:small subunit ribosomal protein S8
MSLSDPIADMLTRIRNAVRIEAPQVNVKASKVCEGIAKVLKEEGYINDYDRIDDSKQGIIRISLKYDPEYGSVVSDIKRISKPGRRVYKKVDELPSVMGGLGIAVVSTSEGVLSDNQCREKKISGELLCMVS